METNTILEKFQGKLLGVGYKNDENYYLDNFLDENFTVEFIVNTVDYQCTFTKLGFEFIEQYYGIENIISMISKKYPNYPFEPGLAPKKALLTKKEFAIDTENLSG
jgi:hypothetical protein